MSDNDIVFELITYLQFLRDRKHSSISEKQFDEYAPQLYALLKEDDEQSLEMMKNEILADEVMEQQPDEDDEEVD